MFKILSLCVFYLASASAFAFGNQDVIQLLAAGMDEKTVADAIAGAAPATFDTSAPGLIALKQAGASPAIIQKVIARQSANASPAKTMGSNGGACQLESVGMANKIPIKVDGKIIGLLPQKVQNSNNLNIGMGILTLATSGIVNTAGTSSLTLPGSRAAIRITDKTPEFVDFLLSPTRSPEEWFALLRLTADGDSRRAQTGTSSTGVLSDETKRDFGNGLVQVSLEKVEDFCTWRGMPEVHYRMRPSEPLASGEYGLLIGGMIFDFGVD